MRRRVQAVLFGITLLALASLYLSYSKLVRNVELAAASSGLLEGDAAAV